MKTITDQTKVEHLLTRSVSAVYPKEDFLRAKLMSGERLRLYVGFDPTAPFLHIGHAMQLRKLREFQDLGHEVIMLIGSFTAMIGDPTDKMATRKQLTAKEVMANAATYKKQASKIVDFTGKNPVKIMFNHKWLRSMNFGEVMDLASHFTVQQMSERDMFAKRLADGKPVYLHEFMYPLMQAYDSVAMDVDGELGGSDQTFNMLAGRTLMKEINGKEKFVLTLKLLTNDEGKKMSKSEGGFIALTDAPEEMFGKVMAMDDSMILPYFELVTDVSLADVAGMKIALEQGINPRDLKVRLATTVVTMFHSAKAAEAAAKGFDAQFRDHQVPTDIPKLSVGKETGIIDVLVESGLAASRGEARRQIEQGGVKIDGVVVTDINLKVVGTKDGVLVQKGKRFFVKLVL